MPTQLSLFGIFLKDNVSFENFYVGDNLQIVNTLKDFITQQTDDFIYLWGKRGSGCSHLLQACCHLAEQHQQTSMYLPLSEMIKYTPDVLEDIDNLQVICIDDVDMLAIYPEWQEAVFHLYNRLRAKQAKIIFAATQVPNQLQLTLADLTSRLNHGLTFQVHSLSDQDKLAALMHRATMREMNLSEEVGQFMMRRCPRNTHQLFHALEQLDIASFDQQRRLTIPFVKEVLGL